MLKSTIRSFVPEAVYDSFRRARQRRATEQFAGYSVDQTISGVRLNVLIADPVAAQWYGQPIGNAPEIDFLQKLDLKGKTVFDLGSHQGVTSMLLAAMVGEKGEVIGVEPNAHNHEIARKNMVINDLQNVTPVKAIVSSGFFNVSIDGGLVGRTRLAGGSTPELDILTIDDISAAFGDPSLVFVDIEGHEIEALIGALKTLAVQGCDWMIELHGDESLSTYGHKNSDIFRFFPDGMFQPYLLDETSGAFKPFTRKQLPHTRCHVFFKRLGAADLI